MKLIGHSDGSNDVIVELNAREYKVLCQIAAALGKAGPENDYASFSYGLEIGDWVDGARLYAHSLERIKQVADLSHDLLELLLKGEE